MKELMKPTATDSPAPLEAAACQEVAGGAETFPVETGACDMVASYDALVDAASALIERVMTATKAL